MNQDIQATVDVVLLTLRERRLSVALVRRNNPAEPYFGQYALPGGFVHVEKDRDTGDTARRVLVEKARMVCPYLEQLRTFSGQSRDPRRWSISVAYVGLIPAQEEDESVELKWTAVDELVSLPFDHKQIVDEAAERVRSKTAYSSLPLFLLRENFTILELQRVYEALMAGELEARGFRRKIEELGVIEPVPGKTRTDGARPAQLYRRKQAGGLRVAGALLEVKE